MWVGLEADRAELLWEGGGWREKGEGCVSKRKEWMVERARSEGASLENQKYVVGRARIRKQDGGLAAH